jgi:molybdopterin synthase sulfur carrier subunit
MPADADAIPIRLLFFAQVRERAGTAAASVQPPPEVTDVGRLVAWLRQRDDAIAAALADLACVRIAVNEDYAALTTPLAGGDEVAFFPPVTGGCGGSGP